MKFTRKEHTKGFTAVIQLIICSLNYFMENLRVRSKFRALLCECNNSIEPELRFMKFRRDERTLRLALGILRIP